MPLMKDLEGRPLRLQDFQVTAVVADERRLLLHLTGPLSILIGSLHAPCFSATHPMDELQAWWNAAEMLEPFS